MAIKQFHTDKHPKPRTPPTSGVQIPQTWQGTPIKHMLQSTQVFASQPATPKKRVNTLVREMEGHFLGAMPPQLFLDEFLPLRAGMTPEVPPSRDQLKGCFNAVVFAGSESGMYKPFIEALQPYVHNMLFLDTHAHKDPERDRLSPDISLYHSNDLPKASESPINFAKISTFIELKKGASMDPFTDPQPSKLASQSSIEHGGEAQDENRGQIGSYSAAISGTQFRVHVLSVSICGRNARFLRWDRAGTLVTSTFDYVANPETLVSFFWRYSRLNFEQQGYDTTVSAASEEEVAIMQEAGCKDRIKDANKGHQEFRKMMVPDRDDPTVEKPFLISYPPVYTARSPFARATRAMLAFDLTAKGIVFLKDYWRADVEGMEKEGEIYRILAEKNVRHIAPFGMGNDVKDHKTITQMWTVMPRMEWATSTAELILLRHYRMTLNVVGRVLTEFESSRQFVSAIADAMEGHDDAYFIANILHRDISVGNILLTDDKQGMLIDWDLCVNLANRSLVPRRPSRTGTWQFMSAVLLNNASSPHDILDDRESAFHVLLWVALQYTKHTVRSPPTPFANTSTSENLPPQNEAARFLQAFEEAWVDPDGNVRGGSTKRIFFTTDDLSRLQFRDRPELDSLIEELVDVFRARYGPVPTAAQAATLKAVIDAGLGEEHIRAQHAYVYQDRMDKLVKQGWLVETIRYFLGRGIWPENDKAEFQHHVAPRDSMAPPKTGSKRKALELDKNDEDQRPAKRASSCLHR